MTFADLQSLMKNRMSVRSFSSKAVDKATVEKLVEAATLAPSIENTQPWHFHCITDEKLMKELQKVCCYGNFVTNATVFIVVTCDRSAKGTIEGTMWNPKEMEYSCVGAMYGLMLAAEAEGLSSCWVSLHHGPAHNILKLKDHLVVIGGIMLGYPDKTENDAVHDRRPLNDVITWHQ